MRIRLYWRGVGKSRMETQRKHGRAKGGGAAGGQRAGARRSVLPGLLARCGGDGRWRVKPGATVRAAAKDTAQLLLRGGVSISGVGQTARHPLKSTAPRVTHGWREPPAGKEAMKRSRYILAGFSVLLLGAGLIACSSGSNSNSNTNPNPPASSAPLAVYGQDAPLAGVVTFQLTLT